MQLLFMRWLDGMKQMKLWQVPRSYTGCAWCDNEKITLHAFGDASEKGYGACVYLAVRFSDGSMTSSLVISKARVALTRFNKIATQGAPQMAVDKEANSLSRVYSRLLF